LQRYPVKRAIERGGQVVINLLAHVKQKTIEPLIKDTIDPGTRVYTDVHYRTLSQHGDISINSLNQTVFIFFPAGH
jgi:hypothetical protein